MIIFFREALNDWILSSSIYNAIYKDYKDNVSNVGLMVIDGDHIITLNNNHSNVDRNENVTIIAHANDDGDFCDLHGRAIMSITFLRDLLISILPDDYTGTIILRSCYSGRNSIGSQKIYSLTHRIYELLKKFRPNIAVKGSNGLNIDYLDFDFKWHELCVNPVKENEAFSIQKSLVSCDFYTLRIPYPTNHVTICEESKKIAGKTRGFFVEFGKNLTNRNCLLTAKQYNYWSRGVEGQM